MHFKMVWVILLKGISYLQWTVLVLYSYTIQLVYKKLTLYTYTCIQCNTIGRHIWFLTWSSDNWSTYSWARMSTLVENCCPILMNVGPSLKMFSFNHFARTFRFWIFFSSVIPPECMHFASPLEYQNGRERNTLYHANSSIHCGNIEKLKDSLSQNRLLQKNTQEMENITINHKLAKQI